MASLVPLPDISTNDLYARLAPIARHRASFHNWGETFRCTPRALFVPTEEAHLDAILELARREDQPVRAIGVGHSPSDLACTTGYMVRMDRLAAVLDIDPEKLTATVQGGITLERLHAALDAAGLAMLNAGSISQQTLAGAITTATHGTGLTHKVLSTHVLAMRVLLADGARVRCSRTEDPDLFFATLCGLGATGIILDITMRVAPAFRLREVQDTRSFDAVVPDLDAVVRSAEFVRIWWWPQADAMRVSCIDKTDEAPRPVRSWLWHSLVGYHVLQLFLFVGILLPALNLAVARFCAWLVRGRTVAVDRSLDIFNLDCKYRQHTTEWAVPYTEAAACLRELRAWFDTEFADPDGLRPHCVLEVRFSEADDVWLSPCYGQRMCWIGIVQYKPYGLNVPYRQLFRRFEAVALRHGGRPHWAKAHHLRPRALRALYPRFDAFRALLARVDPAGRFRNEYVARHVWGAEGDAVGERVFKVRP
ncbi:L-gulonolactone/D-arabinono-1,4-lactone oxidase [Artomyces pyxidatus]|uniref:L-gulonolactone/D-arabinono-1,4-lactone oxidase n=1 Tax=Artomyces pyxidatus TaxID=48021 RepID=A0ACB8SV92_9AGAM|nr:L-gulonolactone/D-arabinono-1,4-lactone oxidase [Artomyces pyxidatus]